MKCFECGTKMNETRENVKYTDSGLKSVVLCNIQVRKCPECGELEHGIPRLSELHQLIVELLVSKPERLIGEEVRFLRKSLGWSAADFAKRIGADKSTVSRWENDVQPIGATSDRLLRALVLVENPIEDYCGEFLESIAIKEPKPLKVQIKHTSNRWLARAQ